MSTQVNDQTNEVKNVRSRRGVAAVKATSLLKFKTEDKNPQIGLFQACLADVTVDWSEAKEDAQSFAGLKIPRLTFHWTSLHKEDNEKRHLFTSFFPQPSNVDTIPGGKEEWKINNILRFIKHVFDVLYLKGKEFSDEDAAKLDLPLDDIDEEGNFVALDPEEVVKAYQVMFENVAALLNGDGKPCFKDANGQPVALWLKLIRCKKTKNGWVNNVPSGDLDIDRFVGQGFIEIIVKGKTPTLSIDPIKESIAPQEVKKAPDTIASGVAGIGAVDVDPTAVGMQDAMFGANSPF